MTAQEIITNVCEKWAISEDQLKSQSRINVFVLARQEASKKLHKELGLSYPSIGVLLGGRCNATIRSYFK